MNVAEKTVLCVDGFQIETVLDGFAKSIDVDWNSSYSFGTGHANGLSRQSKTSRGRRRRVSETTSR